MSHRSAVLSKTIAALALSAASLAPSIARADSPSTGTGKGIAGGALLGGELVMTFEALVGVEKPWAYAGGALVGMAGGGVGGYYIEKGADRKVPLYMLAGGVALVIPATIVALNATAYRPPKDYVEEKVTPGTEPAADAPTPRAPEATPPSSRRIMPPNYAPPPTVQAPPRPSVPASLVAVGPVSGLRLGVPAVEIQPRFTVVEMKTFGVAQSEEFRVPVFHAVF